MSILSLTNLTDIGWLLNWHFRGIFQNADDQSSIDEFIELGLEIANRVE